MLCLSFLLGALVAGKLRWELASVGLGAAALFVSRESLLIWWRARKRGREAVSARRLFLVYVALAGLCAVPLALAGRLFGLLPVGLVALILLVITGRQGAARKDRTIASELLAVSAIALTAPATLYAVRGRWEMTGLSLWLLCVLYFGSSVFYIRMRMLSARARKPCDRDGFRLACAGYHSSLLIALMLLWLSGSLPAFVLTAFAPVLGRTFWALARPVGHLDLKRIGILEIAYSFFFLVFAALAFQLG